MVILQYKDVVILDVIMDSVMMVVINKIVLFQNFVVKGRVGLVDIEGIVDIQETQVQRV